MTTTDHAALVALFERRLRRALVQVDSPEARSIPCIDRLARHAITSAFDDLVALGERRTAQQAVDAALARQGRG